MRRQNTIRFLLSLIILVIWFSLYHSVNAQTDRSIVYVLQANGDVAPAMRDYITRGIRTAELQKAGLLVIELNTPGGFIVSMTEIVTNIRASSVPVVVFVTPPGAMAGSAGTLISLAGHASAMSPETIIGAASPVGSQGQDLETTVKAKEIEALTAIVRSISAQRSPEAIRLAQDTIKSAKAVTAQEAKAANLVDFIAVDLQDLLSQLDGYPVQLESGTQILHTTNSAIIALPVNPGEQILDILVKTDTVFLFMAVGLIAILIELSSPGGWVAGFTGVVALVLSIYGFGMLTVNWFGVIFIFLAFILFVIEFKAPTHGAMTVAGIGSFIIGALVLFNSPDVPEFQHVSVPLVVAVALLMGLFFAVIIGFAMKAQHTPLSMGQQTLIGMPGLATGALDPRGQVQLKSELWSAELADGAESIRPGEKVVVVAVEGLRLKVMKESKTKNDNDT